MTVTDTRSLTRGTRFAPKQCRQNGSSIPRRRLRNLLLDTQPPTTAGPPSINRARRPDRRQCDSALTHAGGRHPQFGTSANSPLGDKSGRSITRRQAEAWPPLASATLSPQGGSLASTPVDLSGSAPTARATTICWPRGVSGRTACGLWAARLDNGSVTERAAVRRSTPAFAAATKLRSESFCDVMPQSGSSDLTGQLGSRALT
jgi:hypothetical protein